MKTLEVLSYWWQVIRRAAADTLAYIAEQRLASLTILFLIGLVVYLGVRARFPHLVKEWGNPMDKVIEFAIFSLVAVVIYACALFVVNLIATPARMSRDQETQIKKLLPPDDLDLHFNAFVGKGVGGEEGTVQFMRSMAVNRSKKNMDLYFVARIYYTTDAGEKHALILESEWNGGDKEHTGAAWISVPSESTFVGMLKVFVPNAKKYGLAKWDIDPTKDVYFKVLDSITGTEVYFKAMPGYPEGRVDKFPPAQKTMATLGFKIEVIEPDKKISESKP
jgi:hypothetical protein